LLSGRSVYLIFSIVMFHSSVLAFIF
jgi:hypothetical protein